MTMMMMTTATTMTTTTTNKKYFPIKVDPACPLKWNWSTLYIDRAQSACCHRTGFYPLTTENFDNFHNNPKVVAERIQMLNGNWPEESCFYCRQIESNNGFSDRMWHRGSEGLVPQELQENPTAVVVTPTVVEVFFDNLCNMSCLYCSPRLSSRINGEFVKFGAFEKNGVSLVPEVIDVNNSSALIEKLFEWMTVNLNKISRFNVLGGEPLLQPEFYRTLDLLEKHPCPNLEFEIVTNLKHDPEKFKQIVLRLKTLAVKRCFKRVDIVCSIDCWGEPQEYIRYGINLDQWQKNFETLLENKWITTSINITLSVLSVKSMPDLLKKINEWRKVHRVGVSISGVTPNPSWLKIDIFGPDLFANDYERILSLLPTTDDFEKRNVEYIKGIAATSQEAKKEDEVIKLYTFLQEKDRRNGTNWKRAFPWLILEFEKCGIVE